MQTGQDSVSADGIDLTAAASGIAEGALAAAIAPAGQLNYTSATAAQKEYAYLADVATLKMSNGDAGYAIA